MTNPLLLAPTGASKQGASLFGDAAKLDVKWRLGGSTIDPSAGIAAPKADLAGKKADFAQTLRDKKTKAAENEPAAKPKAERERPTHVEGTKVAPKKARRAEEKPAAENKKAERADDHVAKEGAQPTDEAAQATDAAKPASDSDKASTPVDPQAVNPTVETQVKAPEAAAQPVEVAVAPLQVQQSAETPVVDSTAKGEGEPETQQAGQASDVKATAQVVVPQTQQAAGNAAAAAAAKTGGKASGPSQRTIEVAKDRDVSAKGEDEPVAVKGDEQAVQTDAAKVPAEVQPKAVEVPHASKAKAQFKERTPTDAESEPVQPASESGAKVRSMEAKGDRASSDRQAEPEFAPAPVKDASPVPDIAPQATRVEATASTSTKLEPVAAVPTAPVVDAAAGAPRIEAAAGVQTNPSAEMLRALAPGHSAPSTSAAPQSAQANTAAANQDYQRLLGQQVERGIAQAMQQATAATDAMVAGTGAVMLRLHPAHLGQLKVQIRIEGGTGGVRARFEASSAKAKGLLGESIESLKTALEGRGLRVDEVVVAQSPRLPEPDLGGYTPGSAQDGRAGAGDAGAGFANRQDQAALSSSGAPASGDSRQSTAETGKDIPIGGLGEQPVWLTGAAGWRVDADGNIRVDALV